jgi:hypothetical protein
VTTVLMIGERDLSSAPKFTRNSSVAPKTTRPPRPRWQLVMPDSAVLNMAVSGNVVISGDDFSLTLSDASQASAAKPEIQDDYLNTFLAAVYALDRAGQTRLAIDQVLDYIDDLLLGGRFDECDAAMEAVDPQRLTDPLIVSFLGITLGARTQLRARVSFFTAAQNVIAERRGGLDAANRLLLKYQ